MKVAETPDTREAMCWMPIRNEPAWLAILHTYAFALLPRARMRSRGKAMPSCLCVCVCLSLSLSLSVSVCVSAKIYWKMLQAGSQSRKGIYRRHSQWKTISIIILGCFYTWYKSRWFFVPLFQLLPIISFMAPYFLFYNVLYSPSDIHSLHTVLIGLCPFSGLSSFPL